MTLADEAHDENASWGGLPGESLCGLLCLDLLQMFVDCRYQAMAASNGNSDDTRDAPDGARQLAASKCIELNSDQIGLHLQVRYLSGRVDVVVNSAETRVVHEMLCRRKGMSSIIGCCR